MRCRFQRSTFEAVGHEMHVNAFEELLFWATADATEPLKRA